MVNPEIDNYVRTEPTAPPIPLDDLVLHDIGWAVKQLVQGRRVCRRGWNGKDMWLVLHQAGSLSTYIHENSSIFGWHDFVTMKTAEEKMVPWLCSQTDLLATDWELA